ncbi:MAG: MEDS domain-containing protein [Thermoproteota archaeon]|nr:MEDS domain-containing protein [Thermoproteota archaeon]
MRGSFNRINVSPQEFLRNLRAYEHGCVFFFSKEGKQNILFDFVKSGLENNWGVVYIVDMESIDKIIELMQKYDINLKQYEKSVDCGSSLIIIKGDEMYKDPNNPDIENWINTIKSLSDMFISRGKRGVRVAADLSSYFVSNGLSEQWYKLEDAIESKPSLPISVLCAYDSFSSKVWDTDVLKYYLESEYDQKEFVDVHSFVIYTSGQESIIYTIN